MSCSKCSDPLLVADALTCVSCEGEFHFACGGMIEQNFRKLNRNAKANWKCFNCKASPGSSGVALEDKLEALINGMRKEMKEEASATRREISEMISGLNGKLDSCLMKYESLNGRMNEMIANFESNNFEFDRRLSDLERLRADGQSSYNHSLNLELTVAECEDRRRRATNVIVYDIPESALKNVLSATEEDLARIKQSLEQLKPEFASLLRRLTRIGKFVQGKCRPIKLVFDLPSTATDVLIANRSTQSPVFSASSDRTPSQRAYLKGLRDELARRTASGEQNLTIRYVSGVPSIVLKEQSKRSSSSLPKNDPHCA
ncbi:hypothetical protein GE061_010534 [Apolygus lucorum]|uniref:PHD-type domain-containing protein n=1 Tax=Apolygus lucorum TaxID=248454 RepID=A0A6A4K682_APOLU|nr:hypothetical protein GE061_010534 [Apolygus lucorum]